MTAHREDDSEPNRDGFVDPATIMGIITEGLKTPPVGLVLLEVLIDADEDHGPIDREQFFTVVLSRLEAQTSAPDVVSMAAPDRLTIVKPRLTAPAEAEGFALRVQTSLGSAMLVGDARVRCQTAIGVAVSRSGDSAEALHRYAQHALGDARMLGGDMVVAFDDQDRDLLIR